jgi:hypothetical protein
MRLGDLEETLALENLTPEIAGAADREVARGFAGDLLSDVLAHAPKGGILVTIQVHLNVVAVASHAGLHAVVFAAGRRPDEAVRRRAVEEGIALLGSAEEAFDLSGKLYASGLRGGRG